MNNLFCNHFTRWKHSTFGLGARSFPNRLWSVNKRFVRIQLLTKFSEPFSDSFKSRRLNKAVHLIDKSAHFVKSVTNGLLTRSNAFQHLCLSDSAFESECAPNLSAKSGCEQGADSGFERSLELLFRTDIGVGQCLKRCSSRSNGSASDFGCERSRKTFLKDLRSSSGFCGSTNIGDCSSSRDSFNNLWNSSSTTCCSTDSECHKVHRGQQVSSDLTGNFASSACGRLRDSRNARTDDPSDVGQLTAESSAKLPLLWRSRQ